MPQLREGGWSPPRGDRRTHVAIERGTHAARTGALFQTEGLDLSPPIGLGEDPRSDFRLLVKTGKPLCAAMAQLGGERRLARIEPREDRTWPKMSPGWLNRIKEYKGIVLTLLTPALFAAGYRPGWLSPRGKGPNPTRLTGSPPGLESLELTLRAAALGRWQPHSGWDLAAQKPRAGRKLVPAGAVYWLAIEGHPSDADLEALWLTSICDHGQDRRDGFGLALPAPWQPPPYENECNTSE
jgi:CRISPR-associated protein Cmr3